MIITSLRVKSKTNHFTEDGSSNFTSSGYQASVRTDTIQVSVLVSNWTKVSVINAANPNNVDFDPEFCEQPAKTPHDVTRSPSLPSIHDHNENILNKGVFVSFLKEVTQCSVHSQVNTSSVLVWISNAIQYF